MTSETFMRWSKLVRALNDQRPLLPDHRFLRPDSRGTMVEE